MKRNAGVAALAISALTLGGCISTAKTVVTAPFKVVGQAADWATTSQDESDRNYGRKMRKQEEREGKERRKADKKAQTEARERDGDD